MKASQPNARASLQDHLLSGVASILAVYSAAVGISAPSIGLFLASGILLGTLVAVFASRKLTKIAEEKVDTVMYVLAATMAVLLARPLNGLLPEGGYPEQLIVATWLSWMVVLGSFVAWRDQTLMFQLVPCIALFGLVCAWDTFALAPLLFFIFTLAAAALFFRAHERQMVEQAQASGTSAQEAIQRGAWRWMAGPEWALGSALVVVVVSAFAAPLVQASVSEFSIGSPLRIPQRSQAGQQAARASTLNFGSGGGEMELGRGPNAMADVDVLRVRASGSQYLRGEAFYVHRGRSWDNAGARPPTESMDDQQTSDGISYEVTDASDVDRDELPYIEVEVLGGLHNRLYVDGTVYTVNVSAQSLISRRADSIFLAEPSLSKGAKYSALVKPLETSGIESASAATPTGAGIRSDILLDDSSITDRVRRLAEEVSAGAASDYDKAERIRQAIAARVKYNLNARPTPAGTDPVDHFLFESREGYCDLFASSMVLMARSVGLPARVATGFLLSNGEPDALGVVTVRDRDYHAWAEIYFEGYGWVPFDATEGAEEVEGGGIGSQFRPGGPWWREPWVTRVAQVLMFIGVVGVILVAARGFGSSVGTGSFRGWLKDLVAKLAFWRREAAAPRTVAQQLYLEFLIDLRKRSGKPRRISETTSEYVERVGPALGPAHAHADELTMAFEHALFAPGDPSEQQLGAIQSAVKALRAVPKAKQAR